MKRQLTLGIFLSTVLILMVLNPSHAEDLAQGYRDFSLTAASRTSPVNLPWSKTQIDTTENVGRHISMAIEQGSGMTFISYHDRGLGGTLNLARYIGEGGNCGPDNTYFCNILDSFGTVGEYNDIDVYPSGDRIKIIITYYDFIFGALKYVDGTMEDGSFVSTIHTLDAGKPANGYFKGKHTSVKFDSTGIPHVAYQYTSNYTGEVQLYARWVGDGSGNCGEGSVAGQWQCDSIYGDEGVGMYASLDLDEYDNPYIAFYDADNGYPWIAQYIGSGGNCGPDGVSWYCRSIQNPGSETGMYISLYVDNANKLHLAYYNANNETVEYAKDIGSNGNCGFNDDSNHFEWQCDRIDITGTSLHAMGIAITGDGDGNPIIAYQNASDDRAPAALKIAYPLAALNPYAVPNCGPTVLSWYCQVIDGGRSDFDQAGAVAIVTNAAGFASIAYHELDGYSYPADGNLKLAYQRLQLFLPQTPNNYK
jgi:hypothetical protein